MAGRATPDPAPREVVLYLGCNVLQTSHMVQTVTDILDRLDVDYVAVGGPACCCGIVHHRGGDYDTAQSTGAVAIREAVSVTRARRVPEAASVICSVEAGLYSAHEAAAMKREAEVALGPLEPVSASSTLAVVRCGRAGRS